MEAVFETLKIVLPAIITGLFTFLITKYTYNKNRPLDKIEIAYNRVYYPLYRIISNENINNINDVINKSKIYFIKYDKYIDISTKRLFEVLCKCNKLAKKESIYLSFKNNIYNRNSYIRRRLGYLEPGFTQIYKYSSPNEKALFRLALELIVIDSIIIFKSMTTELLNIVYLDIIITVLFLLLCLAFFEIMCIFIRSFYYKIRK